MCGMKRDCGGAAGILGAFYAAVKLVRIIVYPLACENKFVTYVQKLSSQYGVQNNQYLSYYILIWCKS
jgi:leucyl aminopeptidase